MKAIRDFYPSCPNQPPPSNLSPPWFEPIRLLWGGFFIIAPSVRRWGAIEGNGRG